MQSKTLTELSCSPSREEEKDKVLAIRGHCLSASFAPLYNLQERDHDAGTIFPHRVRQTVSQPSSPQYKHLLLSVWSAIIASLYGIDANKTSASFLFMHFSVRENGIEAVVWLIFCKIAVLLYVTCS